MMCSKCLSLYATPRGKHRAFDSGHASGKCFLKHCSSEQPRTADWWLSCGPKTLGGTGQSQHPTFLVRAFRSGVKGPWMDKGWRVLKVLVPLCHPLICEPGAGISACAGGFPPLLFGVPEFSAA